jgi:diguanylate cyclase (GGDEF)-like protein
MFRVRFSSVVPEDDTAVSDITRPIPVEVVDDCLVVVHQRSGIVGQCIRLARFPARIGRDLDNEIVLDEDGVSRRHARLERRGTRTVIMDTASRNGTLVNNVELEGTVELQTGDRIKIGPTVFKYLNGTDPDALLHEQIYRTAITDELTDLRNKRFFAEIFGQEHSRARRHARPLSLLVIDIDHFKAVNDTYGHHVGDVTLKAVADVIRLGVRTDDTAARYGGEEIAVLLPETSLSEAVTLAERLRDRISALDVTYRETSFRVTVSVGCAQLQADEGINEFFERADRQTYVAKEAGRNRVRW